MGLSGPQPSGLEPLKHCCCPFSDDGSGGHPELDAEPGPSTKALGSRLLHPTSGMCQQGPIPCEAAGATPLVLGARALASCSRSAGCTFSSWDFQVRKPRVWREPVAVLLPARAGSQPLPAALCHPPPGPPGVGALEPGQAPRLMLEPRDSGSREETASLSPLSMDDPRSAAHVLAQKVPPPSGLGITGRSRGREVPRCPVDLPGFLSLPIGSIDGLPAWFPPLRETPEHTWVPVATPQPRHSGQQAEHRRAAPSPSRSPAFLTCSSGGRLLSQVPSRCHRKAPQWPSPRSLGCGRPVPPPAAADQSSGGPRSGPTEANRGDPAGTGRGRPGWRRRRAPAVPAADTEGPSRAAEAPGRPGSLAPQLPPGPARRANPEPGAPPPPIPHPFPAVTLPSPKRGRCWRGAGPGGRPARAEVRVPASGPAQPGKPPLRTTPSPAGPTPALPPGLRGGSDDIRNNHRFYHPGRSGIRAAQETGGAEPHLLQGPTPPPSPSHLSPLPPTPRPYSSLSPTPSSCPLHPLPLSSPSPLPLLPSSPPTPLSPPHPPVPSLPHLPSSPHPTPLSSLLSSPYPLLPSHLSLLPSPVPPPPPSPLPLPVLSPFLTPFPL
ncbi:uncharacterized protein LOC144577187 [Callithrix jacchus]